MQQLALAREIERETEFSPQAGILVCERSRCSLWKRSCGEKSGSQSIYYRSIRVVSLRSFVRCQTNLPPGAISTRMPSPFPLLVRGWLAHTIAKRLLYLSHSRGLLGALRNAHNCSAKLPVLQKKNCSSARNNRIAKLTTDRGRLFRAVLIPRSERSIDRSIIPLDLAIWISVLPEASFLPAVVHTVMFALTPVKRRATRRSGTKNGHDTSV